jgi:hypothetical protein
MSWAMGIEMHEAVQSILAELEPEMDEIVEQEMDDIDTKDIPEDISNVTVEYIEQMQKVLAKHDHEYASSQSQDDGDFMETILKGADKLNAMKKSLDMDTGCV